MIKVLLLGGTGKLGKYVLKELLATNFEIGVFVRNPDQTDFEKGDYVNLFQGDITDKHSLDAPVQWADIIVNCSGFVSYRRNEIDKLRLINVEGVRNVVAACSKYGKKLLHTSSVVVYGSTKQPAPFKEDSYPKESYKSGYSISKIEAEKSVLQLNAPKSILRPSSLISQEKSTLKNLYNFYKKGFIAGLKGGASFALMEDTAKAYIPAIQLLISTTSNEPLIFNLGGNNLSFETIFNTFKTLDRKKAYFLPDRIMCLLSRFNDYLLYPLTGKSIITFENYLTGSHFTFVDSSKAIKELQYNITPFELSLKEI